MFLDDPSKTVMAPNNKASAARQQRTAAGTVAAAAASGRAVLYGDHISVYSDMALGYLTSPGVADPRLLVEGQPHHEEAHQSALSSLFGGGGDDKSHEEKATTYPNDFERSVFVLEPSSLALKGRAVGDDGDLNELGNRTLSFGNLVLIRHVHTGYYVHVNRRQRAKDKSCTAIQLSPFEAVQSEQVLAFRVLPRYKLRHEGEPVLFGDHVILVNDMARTCLHCSQDIDNPPEYEVNLCTIGDAWMLFPYVTLSDRRHVPRAITTGRPVVLFHKEAEGFLTGDCVIQLEMSSSRAALNDRRMNSNLSDSSSHRHSLAHGLTSITRFDKSISAPNVSFVRPPISDATYTVTNLDFSTNSLWLFEYVNPTRGGVVQHADVYRIKHVISGAYLAVSRQGREQTLTLVYYTTIEEDNDDEFEDEHTTWVLHGCDDKDEVVQSESTFCRIQNRMTGLWLHSLTGQTAQYTNFTMTHSVYGRQSMMSSAYGSFGGKHGRQSIGSQDPLMQTHNSGYSLSRTLRQTRSSNELGLNIGGPKSPLSPSRTQAFGFDGPEQTMTVTSTFDLGGPNLCPYSEDETFVQTDGTIRASPSVPHEEKPTISAYSMNANAIPLQMAPSMGVASTAQLSERSHYSDVFSICTITTKDALDINMIVGNVHFMRAFVYHFLHQKSTDGGACPYGSASMDRIIGRAADAVAKLIKFCTRSEVSNVMHREGLPIRKNQRYLYDQNVHLVVLDMLKAPFTSEEEFSYNVQTVDELEDGIIRFTDIRKDEHRKTHYVLALCFRLLKQMMKANPTIACGVTEQLPFLLSLGGFGFHVSETLREMFFANTDVSFDLFRLVVDNFKQSLLNKAVYPDMLKFFGTACTVQGHGRALFQDYLAREILSAAPELLFQFNPLAGVVHVRLPIAKKFGISINGPTKVNLADDWVPMSAVIKYAAPQIVEYLDATLYFLSRVSIGGLLTTTKEFVDDRAVLAALTGPENTTVSDNMKALFLSVATYGLVDPELNDAKYKIVAIPSESKPSIVSWVGVAAGPHTARERSHSLSAPTPTPTSARTNSASGFGPAAFGDTPLTNDLKHFTLRILRLHTAQSTMDLKRNRLLTQMCVFWNHVVRYGANTSDETTRLVASLYAILDGRKDVVDSPAPNARYEWSEGNVLIMATKNQAIEVIHGLLDALVVERVHEFLRRFKKDVTTHGRLATADGICAHAVEVLDAVCKSTCNVLGDVQTLLPVLLDLAQYQHATLASRTLTLIFRLLCPSTEVTRALNCVVLMFDAGMERGVMDECVSILECVEEVFDKIRAATEPQAFADLVDRVHPQLEQLAGITEEYCTADACAQLTELQVYMRTVGLHTSCMSFLALLRQHNVKDHEAVRLVARVLACFVHSNDDNRVLMDEHLDTLVSMAETFDATEEVARVVEDTLARPHDPSAASVAEALLCAMLSKSITRHTLIMIDAIMSDADDADALSQVVLSTLHNMTPNKPLRELDYDQETEALFVGVLGKCLTPTTADSLVDWVRGLCSSTYVLSELVAMLSDGTQSPLPEPTPRHKYDGDDDGHDAVLDDDDYDPRLNANDFAALEPYAVSALTGYLVYLAEVLRPEDGAFFTHNDFTSLVNHFTKWLRQLNQQLFASAEQAASTRRSSVPLSLDEAILARDYSADMSPGILPSDLSRNRSNAAPSSSQELTTIMMRDILPFARRVFENFGRYVPGQRASSALNDFLQAVVQLATSLTEYDVLAHDSYDPTVIIDIIQVAGQKGFTGRVAPKALNMAAEGLRANVVIACGSTGGIDNAIPALNLPSPSGHASQHAIQTLFNVVKSTLLAEIEESPRKGLDPLICLLREELNTGTAETQHTWRSLVHHLENTELTDSVKVHLLNCFDSIVAEVVDGPSDKLEAVQCGINALGATKLITILLECESYEIVRSTLKFGISLLHGGNPECQDALLTYFTTHDEKFFSSLKHLMKKAETELHDAQNAATSTLASTQTSMQQQGLNSGQKLNSTNKLSASTGPASPKDTGGMLVHRSRKYLFLAQDMLRLLQLLCEGHHIRLQNYVRIQYDNLNSYNMCTTVMHFLRILMKDVDRSVFPVVIQAFNTLTEFCQGPCPGNQACIVSCGVINEANEALLHRCSDSMEIQSAAIITVLSLLEGVRDASIANSILHTVSFEAVENILEHIWNCVGARVAKECTEEDDDALLELGFNIYILTNTLMTEGDKAKASALKELLGRTSGHHYFSSMICNIEIFRDDSEHTHLERVYFRKPTICNSLREETKERLLLTVNRKTMTSKLSDFFDQADDVIFEMEYQHTIDDWANHHTRFIEPLEDVNLAASRQPSAAAGAGNPLRRAYLVVVRYFWDVLNTLLRCHAPPIDLLATLNAFAINGLLLYGCDHTWVSVTKTDENNNIIEESLVSAWAYGMLWLLGYVQLFCMVYLFVAFLIVQLPIAAHGATRRSTTAASSSSSSSTTSSLLTMSIRERVDAVTTRENLKSVLGRARCVYLVVGILFALLGVLYSPFFFAYHLFTILNRSPHLRHIVIAILVNGWQLLMTALLGIATVYIFSIVGFVFFRDDFGSKSDGSSGVDTNNCDTLAECFVFSLGKGVRGGGIGELLSDREWGSGTFAFRELYDFSFFIVIIVVIMNIIFALIVDTFAELRDARQKIEDDMRNNCFICGIDAYTFDRQGEGFDNHTHLAHNLWHYLYFMHHIKRKPESEYTGQESYVFNKMLRRDLTFFPVNRSTSLESVDTSELSGTATATVTAIPSIVEPSQQQHSLADIQRVVEEAVTNQLRAHFKQKQEEEAQAAQDQRSTRSRRASLAFGPGGLNRENSSLETGNNSSGGGAVNAMALINIRSELRELKSMIADSMLANTLNSNNTMSSSMTTTPKPHVVTTPTPTPAATASPQATLSVPFLNVPK
eukprot:PhM_4_TR4472/c0_g4_i1/m.50959/K04959/ITPR2; inositol 1,4,5-triphosphate receptor type 2